MLLLPVTKIFQTVYDLIKKRNIMQNAIKTEKGFFTIIERYDKGFKIEKFDTNISNPNVIKFNILLAFID